MESLTHLSDDLKLQFGVAVWRCGLALRFGVAVWRCSLALQFGARKPDTH
ncbi:hypothetical protein [Alicyclobacillus ferrooxydans]|nr:hypothetical protein [Alicyclobacillus ferrooxydans]